MTTSAVEAQARTLSGYADASRLRQEHDRDWVLDHIPGEPATLVDLGSGIGQLLEAALHRFPSLELAVGLERSPHRITEAAARLKPHGGRVALAEADLNAPAPVPHRPDVVTMTSVLHWLYPTEDRVLAWVREHLAPGGHFLLTTYHPARDEHGLGGEDDIVRDALTALGVPRADVPALFAGGGVLPIATRTRTVEDLAALLERDFRTDGTWERDAVVTVADAAQYTRFHAATFGDYYSGLVTPARREEFFRAVGEAAARRQEERGRVSDMPVRLWRLTPRA
ncbi:class I SAM-dependent methyltransferase [Streptomyces sp. NBC_01803]|uniref:class I SAM-dependent methyltransferase n=1 Tax=Streptomyces sp. NBC_01803 TaxID=2975946 RepID=UPI002DDB49CA|nr:class I SAM-dependent methyltransferase [Streptomyces sp. NBC_01803]WSA43625.1 class I SAM-dependent methyltransferase [Streptomyces sp. NBC_01803]